MKLERTLHRLQAERSQRRSEHGFTLVEILITVFIIILLAGVVTFALTRANSVNENVVNTTMSQAEVLNTTNALTRDLSAADNILFAGEKYVQFETVINSETDLVTIFEVKADGSGTDGWPEGIKALHDKVFADGLYGVYTVRVPQGTDPATGGYKGLLPGGKIDFSYFDETGSTTTDVSKITRIEFYLQSYSAQTDGGDTSSIQMASSASPRLGTGTGDPGNVTNPGNNGLPPAAPTLGLDVRYSETTPGVPTPAINASPAAPWINLTWNAVEGADAYTLYRSNRATGTEAITIVPAGSSLTFTDNNRVFGETYTYWVIASGSFGLSGRSNEPQGVIVPNASISGTAVNLSNNLTWAEPNGVGSLATPTNASGTGYRVYRHAVGATYSTRTLVYEGTNRNYSDTNVNYGDVWVYTVHAFNQGGAGYALNSVTLYSPPLAPVATGTHTRGVRDLSWSAPSNVGVGLAATTSDIYELRRTAPTATSYNTAQAVRTYKDNVSIDSATFTYQVRARNSAGWGPWSNIVTLNPRPLAPNATGSHSNGIRTVTWGVATNVSNSGDVYTTPTGTNGSVGSTQSYEVRRTAPQATTFTRGNNDRTLVDNSTIDSATFTYEVRAWNITGWGPWSNLVTLNPRPLAPVVTVQDFVSNPTTRDGNNSITWNRPLNTVDFVFQGTVRTPSQSYAHTDPGYGSTHNYRVVACNITGCSAEGTNRGLQGPGPFAINAVHQVKSYGLSSDPGNGWVEGTTGSGINNQVNESTGSFRWGEVHASWTNSAGANSYAYSLRQDGWADQWDGKGAATNSNGYTVEPTTGYRAKVRSGAANGTLRQGGGYNIFTAPQVSREVSLGFRTRQGGMVSGSWVYGNATPIRGSYHNAQVYYANVHSYWNTSGGITGVFDIGGPNSGGWAGMATAYKYIYQGENGPNKHNIQRHPNGRVAMRPGGQVFMRAQHGIPGGWNTGTLVLNPSGSTSLDYWTPFAYAGTANGDSSVVYTTRWSTGQVNCWGTWNYPSTPGGCAGGGGWDDVPWSNTNFPRAPLGHSSGNTNYWRVFAL